MKIKQGDFVTIDYTGTIGGKIFDLTDEKLAKKENIYREKTKYGPVTIVIGAEHLLKGLDKELIDKEEGQEFDADIKPEDGFGKKNPKLLKIVSGSIFKNQKINPAPGMQLNIDGILGTIISASGGRVVIDFNHPLAGKELHYKVKINKIVKDKKEQILALLELYTGLDKDKFDVELKDNEVSIKSNAKEKLNEKIREVVMNDIKKYVKLEKLDFTEKEEKKEKKE